MNDARFDRSCTGDAAGDSVPAAGLDRQTDPGGGGHDVFAARDWTRRRRSSADTSTTVHWVDEKGSVVRLISSSSHAEPEVETPDMAG